MPTVNKVGNIQGLFHNVTGALVGFYANGKEYLLGLADEASAITGNVLSSLSVTGGAIFSGTVTFAARVVDSGFSYQTPLTGVTVVLGDTAHHTIFDPAGALAALTVQMPPAPVGGQSVHFCTTQAITALTITPNAGQALANGMPTTLAAGQGCSLIYRSTGLKWFVIP